ncbi:hypothetical protein KO516_18260 [Citreicella sp. C3M06]|uniref:hypothetical protein n=1 Tax=Citreicella sp. C3M06 TaxID=2841564 RepID=UPI001C0803F2|nr:hypothetical protein [Citreicella sp. C3M06]MBU2962735.1 hypothetical protein [Citreicella sp. C3M06]
MREFTADPERTCFAIAQAAGCSAAYVRVVAHREGVTFGRALRVPARATKNRIWLECEALRMNCTIGEVIDAIVTDARLDSEEAD